MKTFRYLRHSAFTQLLYQFLLKKYKKGNKSYKIFFMKKNNKIVFQLYEEGRVEDRN